LSFWDIARDLPLAVWSAAELFGAVSEAEEKTTSEPGLRLIGGASAATAIALFVLQPILRYVDPAVLPAAGGMLIIDLFLLGTPAPRLSTKLQAFTRYFLAGLPVLMILLLAFQAISISNWNDMRCERIQKAMLKPGPNTRQDLPSLFQALGCRPQGHLPFDPNAPGDHGAGAPPTRARVAAHEEFIRLHLDAELSVDRPLPYSKRLPYIMPPL
jgi:hypothetical protein